MAGLERGEDPFFLFLAYTAPHWPLHAHDEDIATYAGRFDAGWDQLREERLERLVKEGIVDASWPLTPRDERVPAWEEVVTCSGRAGTPRAVSCPATSSGVREALFVTKTAAVPPAPAAARDSTAWGTAPAPT